MSSGLDKNGRKGVGFIVIKAQFLDKVKVEADYIVRLAPGEVIPFFDVLNLSYNDLPVEAKNFVATEDCLVVIDHNAYVNTGLNNSLDREFGLGGTAVGFIGVSSSTSAVLATTVFLNGASAGTAANTIIKPISPAATRTAQTVTGGATFTNADFTGGVFIWNKISFLLTSTDAGTGLVDVIGGVGGTAPYNKTFTLDLTGAGAFTVTAQIAVTAVAV